MQINNCDKKTTPIIIGGTGWLGSATLNLVRQCPKLSEPIIFGSGNAIRSKNGATIYPLALFREVMATFSPANKYIIFNFAYLTKDTAGNFSDENYKLASQKINKNIASLISLVMPNALLFISSGAASMLEKGLSNSRDLLIYGKQKIDDERFFSELCKTNHIKFLSPRVFNLGGPFINKLNAYALSNFILQSLSSRRIVIESDRPVYRSYCYVYDLLKVAILEMTSSKDLGNLEVFEVGGKDRVELKDLAKIIAEETSLPKKNIMRQTLNKTLPADNYLADNNVFEALLAKHATPQTDLAQIVKETLSFIQEHHSNQIRLR